MNLKLKLILIFITCGFLAGFANTEPNGRQSRQTYSSKMMSRLVVKIVVDQMEYNRIRATSYEPHLWTLTQVGYIKIGDGGFGAANGCAASNFNTGATGVYLQNRTVLGQVAVGDTLRDAGGTAINGGGQGYGFRTTNTVGPATRGFKINGGGAGNGVVAQLSLCDTANVISTWHIATGTDCSVTSYPTLTYNDPTDATLYVGKTMFTSKAGSALATGNYIASSSSTGPGLYSIAITSGIITSFSCCQTSPSVVAGADASYDLGSGVTINADASDCDGTIASLAWSQLSGPNTAVITPSSNTSSTSISSALTSLAVGTYVFRIVATDNSSNTSSDDITIIIIPAFVGTPLKVQIKSYQVSSFSAESTRGAYGFIGDTSNAAIATVGHKNGAWVGGAYGWVDGMFDPFNSKFDYDTITAGFQNDKTYPYLAKDYTTPYYVGGNGFQRLIYIDLGRKYDMHSIYWLDSGGTALSNVAEVIFGSAEDVRKGIFEFDTQLGFGAPTIAMTLSESATRGWKHDNLRGSGQFILIRLNDVAGVGAVAHSGPGFSNFVFYGLPSADSAKDTRITPNWTGTLTRGDTTVKREGSAGFVWATGAQNSFIRDTFLKAPKTSTSGIPAVSWVGGYIRDFATAGSPNAGVIDRDTNAWHGRTGTLTNKINLNPFQPTGSLPGLWKDSTVFVRPGIGVYDVIINPNAHLLKQTSYASPEHNPVDSAGCDFRQDSSYDRFWFTFIGLFAKIGTEVPDTTQGYGPYLTQARYESDDFPNRWAWGRVQIMIPCNENNIGFRDFGIANSSYMNPFAVRAFLDKGYREWHKVFHNTPFYSTGQAAWKVRSYLEAQLLNNIRYLDMNHSLSDIVNIHAVCETDGLRTSEPGVVDALGSRGEFAGNRNEGMKIQTFLDTLAYINGGRFQGCIFSELAYSTNRNYRVRTDSAGTDASVSTHGVRAVYSSVDGTKYPVYASHGFLMTNIWTHQDGVIGLKARMHYEAIDAADTSTVGCNSGVACGSCPVGQTCVSGTCKFDCYDNSDANDGVYNRYNTNYTPFFKPSYFIVMEDQIWKSRYRVIAKQSDSINGQLRYLYRNVYSTDSFLVFLQWQDSIKPAGDRTFTLFADVTAVTRLQPSWPDWTFAGTNVALTVTGGNVTIRPRPEGDYINFKSPGLKASLDGTSGTPIGKGRFLWSSIEQAMWDQERRTMLGLPPPLP